MSRQVLARKKHQLCEKFGKKKYQICYTTRKHHIFECWYDERNADYVNIEVGYSWPTIRDGQRLIGVPG